MNNLSELGLYRLICWLSQITHWGITIRKFEEERFGANWLKDSDIIQLMREILGDNPGIDESVPT